MVLIKYICAPEAVQATLTVRLTTAQPTISLSALTTKKSPVLVFHIHIRCASSTHPSRPITIFTPHTIFDDSHTPEDGHMDNLALGMLGGGLTRTSEPKKRISFGYFMIHRVRQENDTAPDLRDRPSARFLTIPAQETGEEVVVKHTVTSERLFAYADGMTAEDLVVGERYRAGLSEGYVGATWWCWGGLEEELRGKKLHAYARGRRGLRGGDAPDVDEMERQGWVFGENRAQLQFVMEEEGRVEVGIEE